MSLNMTTEYEFVWNFSLKNLRSPQRSEVRATVLKDIVTCESTWDETADNAALKITTPFL